MGGLEEPSVALIDDLANVAPGWVAATLQRC